MSENELMAKAREHLKTHLHSHPVSGLTDTEFTRTSVRKTRTVTFGAENQEDIIEIVLDDELGFAWSVGHIPKGAKHWNEMENLLRSRPAD